MGLEGTEAKPIRIITLGRFVVEVDGTPLRFETRAQRKPLELLKALVALGGQTIPAERLSESLWPDTDGDQASSALSTTLYRLRKLIGRHALILRDGRLTLDPEQCWADSWAFAESLGKSSRAVEAQDEAAAWDYAEEALALYRGPFLDGEFNLPEFLSEREKLHSLFLRHIEQVGEFFLQAGQPQKAILLYQKGLEVDELAEQLYQRLMRCYQQLGRNAEGISVYQRLRETFRTNVGIEPSSEADAIYQELISEKGKPVGKKSSPPSHLKEKGPEISLSFPKKPSIAVMPFDNLSADPSQEFFADGLVEEILTSLSKIASMTVIARNSTFAYKGKAVDARNVARDLGVRYVVEGRVRRVGNRLRITAQLIDSTDGSHLWAEKYDRVVEDIFDIQDEITKEIVTALRVNLTGSEQALLLNRGTNNVQAWNHCVQAMEHQHKYNLADLAKARELAEEATLLDPDYALAWAFLGFTYWYGARTAFDEDVESGMARAAELAAKALALDETNPWALAVSLLVQLYSGNFEQSLATGKRLISLHPSSADSRARYASALLSSGQPQESLSMVKDAMRLNPRHPLWYQGLLARALDVAGQPEDALEALDGILAQQPNFFPAVLVRTGILAREGRIEEAKEAMTDLRRINPNFRLAHVKGFFMARDQDYVVAFTVALRKAGLPE